MLIRSRTSGTIAEVNDDRLIPPDWEVYEENTTPEAKQASKPRKRTQAVG